MDCRRDNLDAGALCFVASHLHGMFRIVLVPFKNYGLLTSGSTSGTHTQAPVHVINARWWQRQPISEALVITNFPDVPDQ